MNMVQPLPPFIASNMTHEEFQNLLDRSEVPDYLRERFAELLRGRVLNPENGAVQSLTLALESAEGIE